MFCSNYFCIYYHNERCTLATIILDEQGRCKNCLYVNIPEATLMRYREEALASYDQFQTCSDTDDHE